MVKTDDVHARNRGQSALSLDLSGLRGRPILAGPGAA